MSVARSSWSAPFSCIRCRNVITAAILLLKPLLDKRSLGMFQMSYTHANGDPPALARPAARIRGGGAPPVVHPRGGGAARHPVGGEPADQDARGSAWRAPVPA